MTTNKQQAMYLEPPGAAQPTSALARVLPARSSLRAAVFAIIAIVLAFTALVPAAMNSNSRVASADAGEDGFMAFLCGSPSELGSGMNSASDWMGATQRYTGMDLSGRTWTAQELFGSNLSIPHYNGEGPKDKAFLVRGTGKSDRPAKAADAGFIDKSVADALSKGEVKDRLYGQRTFSSCSIGALNTGVSNVTFGLASVITSWVGIAATSAFDSSLICSDADQSGCLNLVKIMGGTGGESEGVIGTLTSSIYFPLLALGVIITGIWLIQVGIVRRQVREALSGALWTFAAVVLGTAFLLNPAMVAKAPMTVANSVGTCVIGAFNGTNCFSGGSTSGDSIASSDDICKSEASGADTSQSMTLAVNGMGCSIWRAFVLEPYSQATFGQPFSKLDTSKPTDDLKEQLDKAGISDPESTFKVSLHSDSPGEDYEGKRIKLDDGVSVSNIALYQLYLKTDAEGTDKGADKYKDGALDGRWYNVVSFAAADPTTWNHWAGGLSGGAAQAGLGAMALLTACLGGFIILITALLALVYYAITIVLTGVAPLFFLMAIHPGRGRRLFLGWVGQVASNVFKYIASAFFLVITVAIYAGVLANSENLATTFLFIIILTAALFLYRGEIVNLLGRVDMGGEKLSNRLGETMERRGRGMARGATGAALGVAGAAVGGAVTTGAGAKASDYFKNAGAGMRDNISRELKRKSGFVGNVARQADRVSADNRQDLRRSAQAARTESTNASGAAEEEYSKAQVAEQDYARSSEALEADKLSLDDLNVRAEAAHKVQNEVLMSMEGDNAAFTKAQGIANSLQDLEMEHSRAVASGDRVRATELQGQIQATRGELEAANAEITSADRARGERRYGTMLRKELEAQGISYTEADRATHGAVQDRVAATEAELEDKRIAAEAGTAQATQAQARAAALKVRTDTMHKKSEDWRPGDKMTTGAVRSTQAKADAEAWEAYRKEGGDLDRFEDSTGIKTTPELSKYIKETKAKEDKREVKAEAKDKRREEKREDKRLASQPAPRKTVAERKAEEAKNAPKRAAASRDAYNRAVRETGSPLPEPKPETEKPRAPKSSGDDRKSSPKSDSKPAASAPKPANTADSKGESPKSDPKPTKSAKPSRPAKPAQPKVTVVENDQASSDATSIPEGHSWADISENDDEN